MYVLTEEGKKYLREGLPEKNLVDLLKEKKKISIEDAKKKVANLGIALQWAKKKNWVMVIQGEIELLKYPEKIEEQEALEKINRGEDVDEKMLSSLLFRKLITKKRKKLEKIVGKEITNLTPELIKTGLWRKVKLKKYNVSAPGEIIYPGKKQPYNKFLETIKRKLVEFGFVEVVGPTIETEFWNFDALYQPQNHPARDWASTYKLKNPKYGDLPDEKIVKKVKATHENGWVTGSSGWKYKWDPRIAMRLMPRAHGTCLSARTLANNPEIPGKYFAIARCYRPDTLDRTHLIEFNQTEGIIIDESLTFRNLLGILEFFAKEIAGAKKVKFYPDYYPFTEPSVQLSAKHPKLGWVEFGGAGIFREELTRPLGVDVPVIAWGLGIDRLAMFKLGIKDIRQLFSYDLNWLRNSKIVL